MPLAATTLVGEKHGAVALATVTFEVIAVKASTLMLTEVVLSDGAGNASRPQVENGQITRPSQVKVVTIPDANLRAAIESELGKASGATITTADMATLTGLYASDANISDLTGLEHATNLAELNLGSNSISDLSVLTGLTNLTGLELYGNSVSDISPLVGLTNLTSLHLEGNAISDISALSDLTNLTWLSVGFNNIVDISILAGLTNLESLGIYETDISNIAPLSRLTNLTDLDLEGNAISDISALSGLTNLTWLNLQDNNISDISSVSGLTNLTYLWLWANNISDLSPLVSNTGLGAGDVVGLNENPLNAVSINSHIPTLRRRGVDIQFDLNTNATVSVFPSLVNSPAVGEQFTLSLTIAGGNKVTGYQASVQFDASALRYMGSANGDYLPAGAFFIPPIADGTQ